MLVVVTAVSGFAQAIVLIVLAGLAVSITGGDDAVGLSTSGLALDLGTGQALAVAGSALVVMVALQLLGAAIAARLMTTALSTARIGLFTAYLHASWELQSQERRGRLQDLITTHLGKVSGGISQLTLLLVGLTNLIVLLVVALVVNPLPALVVLVTMGLLTAAMRTVTRAARHRAAVHAEANVAYTTSLTEMVGLAREIRVFGATDAALDRARRLEDEVAVPHRQLGFIFRSVQVVYQGAALAVLTVGLAVVSALDLGDVPSLGAMVLLLLRSISYGQQTQTALHGLGEMQPYLAQVQDQEAAYRQARVRSGDRPVDRIGTLRLERAGYAYGEGETALADLDLEIAPGEMVGIVGPSGSGKSTLVQLLLRLRDPSTGRYLLDGEPAAGFDLDAWFAHVALVPQDPLLVDGTVAENIRFFRDDLSDDDVERAARLAHVHDEILAFPNGYDTRLEGLSSSISGGQAQRLCIARALARPPGLLVLDEPTSALDLRSESLIQATLEDLAHTTTMLIIAHRISTIRRCDRIAVLDGGRLVAFDTPERVAVDDDFFRQALDLSSATGDAPAVGRS